MVDVTLPNMQNDQGQLTDELNNRFPGILGKEDVVAECLSIMRLYSIDVTELFFKWESYSLNAGNETQLTIDSVRAFKTSLQEQLEQEMRKKRRPQANISTSPATMSSPSSFNDLLEGSSPGTPKLHNSLKRKLRTNTETPSVNKSINRGQPSAEIDAHPGGSPLGKYSTSFRERLDAGKVMESLNPEYELPARGSRSAPKLTLNMEVKKFSFPYMDQKLYDASQTLDERIAEMSEVYQLAYDLKEDEFGNPTIISQTPIVTIGIIASDSPSVGTLNAASLVLETSRQLVAMRGTNVSGDYFLASEILDSPALPLPVSSRNDILEVVEQSENQPVRILIAAGPFTTDGDLSFEPLDEILRVTSDQEPHVVILLGPFIDTDHPLLCDGVLDLATADPSENGDIDYLFKEQISSRLAKASEDTLILLVPHVRDAVSKQACFPQEPLNRIKFGLPKNVKCLPNPATFSIDGVVFGISTQEILHHLSKNELLRNPAQSNLFGRLPSYIISQRNFYPMFPPPFREASRTEPVAASIPESPLDMGYLPLAEFTGATPDVLILPCDLKSFARVVDRVMTINPGRIVKKNEPGTYATMSIMPPKMDSVPETNEEGFANRLWERARVDIVKL